MTDKQIRLDIVANDEASKAIEDVADDADALTKKPHEVDVTADTGKAERGLEETTDTLERIEKQPWVAEVRADIDKALADAKALQESLDDIDVNVDTSDAERKLKNVETGGSNVAGGLRDLGGPLGEMTNQVGDFAEAFESAGAMAAAQFGLSGAATTAMTAGLGAVGVAIGVLSVLWGNVQKANEEAKQRVDDYKAAIDEANGSLREGARLKLAESLSDEDVARLDRYGLTLDDVVAAMSGRMTPAMEDFNDASKTAGDEWATLNSRLQAHAGGSAPAPQIVKDHEAINDLLNEESGALRKAGDVYRARQRVLEDQTSATKAYNDQVSESNRRMGTLVETIGKVPPTKRTDVTVTDNGTADTTNREIDHAARDRDTKVRVEATGDSLRRLSDAIANATAAGQLGVSTTNIVVNAPRGIGWDAAARRAHQRYARRNGGRP